jgi:hypothetical protein
MTSSFTYSITPALSVPDGRQARADWDIPSPISPSAPPPAVPPNSPLGYSTLSHNCDDEYVFTALNGLPDLVSDNGLGFSAHMPGCVNNASQICWPNWKGPNVGVTAGGAHGAIGLSPF